MDFLWVLLSTLIYTSELILCSIIWSVVCYMAHVIFIHLRNLCKMSIFCAFSGSNFALKGNDKIRIIFAVAIVNFEVVGFAPKQKYTGWTVSMK